MRPETENHAVRIQRQIRAHDLILGVLRRYQMLSAIFDPLHRPPSLSRERCHQ
jgi:hypothetical protein